MPTTITAFYSFYADTTALSSEVNTNFSNLRGSLLPIDPNTMAATSLSYDLGSPEYKWRKAYISNFATLSVAGHTSTVDLVFQDGNTTTGLFTIKIGAVTLAALTPTVAAFNFLRVAGATTTANLDIVNQPAVTAGAFDFKIGAATIGTLDTTGFRVPSIRFFGITTTTDLTVQAQAGVTSGAFDFMIGADTAATLQITGWKYSTFTVLGITTTANLVIEPQAGVTAGAYDFKIGGVTVAALGASGWGTPFAVGPTSTANLTVEAQAGVTAGVFDFKIGETTIGVFDASSWRFNNLRIAGATTTAYLEFVGNGLGFDIKIGGTTIGSAKTDGVAFKKRFATSANISDTVATTTARAIVNASLSITTDGFPVILMFTNSTSVGDSYFGLVNGTASCWQMEAYINILRDGTTLGVYNFGKGDGINTTSATYVRRMTFMPGAFQFFDCSASAGGHTYTLQGRVGYTTCALSFSNIELRAMEL